MTPLTDDELGTLLRETFADHEDLADPDRAVALATGPSARPNRHRALVAAAAAVALVAVGTTYVVSQGSEDRPSADPAPPTSSGQPPLPTLQTDTGNRAAAVQEAARVTAHLPALPGAVETDRSGVPQLAGTGVSLVTPTGHTIVRTRWWSAAATTPLAAARWYAAHPPAGFTTEGGTGGVGRSRDGTQWVNETTWDGAAAGPASETTVDVQTTATPTGAGIRLTVLTVWPPARPVTSYVQDVTSIDVRSSHRVVGPHARWSQRSYTLSDPARVLRAATAFDALPGMTPMPLPCPLQLSSYRDRITFHTATGDVVATADTQSCGFGMSVHRAGRLVDPQLGDTEPLLAALGLHH